MKSTPLLGKVVGNEDGFVLAAAMVVLLVLVILGIAATNISNTEYLIASNDRMIKVDFYNQEGCLAQGRFNFRTWLTSAFIGAGETTAVFPINGDANGNGINDTIESNCLDPNGIVVGLYKVRKIEATGTPILAGWADNNTVDPVVAAKHPANQFPPMAHADKPPPGSGYDPKNFEIRRYVMTSYSPDLDRKVILQEGVYKVFNKY